MALGPGKYDDLCTLVRERAKAPCALVIVFDGEKGTGFSAQLDLLRTVQVPEILEAVAAEIRLSMKQGEV